MILHLCDFDQHICKTCFDKMSFRHFRFGCTTKYVHVDTLLKWFKLYATALALQKESSLQSHFMLGEAEMLHIVSWVRIYFCRGRYVVVEMRVCTRPVHKNLFLNFQKIQAVLYYTLKDEQILDKAFCSNVIPSWSSENHPNFTGQNTWGKLAWIRYGLKLSTRVH